MNIQIVFFDKCYTLPVVCEEKNIVRKSGKPYLLYTVPSDLLLWLTFYYYVRVWDKVMSGSSVVLAYVAAALILTHRRPILVMTTSNDVIQLFNQVWYTGNKTYVSA